MTCGKCTITTRTDVLSVYHTTVLIHSKNGVSGSPGRRQQGLIVERIDSNRSRRSRSEQLAGSCGEASFA
ncbi:uncharacterized [Tachysurus ichikawai]